MLLARLSPQTILLKLNPLQSPVASRIYISLYMYQIVNVIYLTNSVETWNLLEVVQDENAYDINLTYVKGQKRDFSPLLFISLM